MVVEEVTQPANANLSIFIARSGNEDLINMSNASLMSIQKAPTRSLLEVIDNQLLLIRINLQLLALWCQLWRTTFNMCWKCWSCNTKLAGNGVLAWWWFLVSHVQILLQSLLNVVLLFLKSPPSLYSCWNWPWHVCPVGIRMAQDSLDSLITISQCKVRVSKREHAFLIITERSWHSPVGCHASMGM